LEQFDPKFLKKYETSTWNNLNFINSYRIKNFSIFLSLLVTLLFIVDYFNKFRGLWSINYGYILLFYSHIALISILVFFIILYYIIKNINKESLFKYYVICFAIFILNITSFTSGWIDQLIHGEITVYTMGCFSIAILLYLKPKHIIIIYMQSYLVFVFCLQENQVNKTMQEGNFINSLMVISLACFISIIMSKLTQREYIYKYKLEELVKERSDALIVQQQAINRLQQFNLIGEMSANIAHEIRNPMTAVRGFLQLLGNRDYYKKDKLFFDIMIQELDRANSIITEFLSLAKEKKYLLEKKNLNSIILKLLPLLDTNSQYTLKSDLGEIPELLLDEKEICQVILNFANNGYEAMPSGGCLTIRTYLLNDKVIFEVQDEGDGIKSEILEKLGTPFFTTKEKGSGLGLAVCYSIIKQHNAQINILSDSRGSNFQVIFDIPS